MLGAGSRALTGELDAPCPRDDGGRLRFYFHAFDRAQGEGTLWVWCPVCGLTVHLPRVRPAGSELRDPFGDLSLEEFAELELDEERPLLDRLDALWETGAITAR
jgi:hypothetical protein